jgi:arginyl-tRNA synthetase
VIKPYLSELVSDALSATLPEEFKVSIEVPKQAGHGDFATNCSFQLAKHLRKAPPQIAEGLVEEINEKLSAKGITASSLGGFINLKLSSEFIWSRLASQFDDGVTFPEHSEKVLMEYVCANPTGPLHIGHGRWAVIGDVLRRLLLKVGRDVSTENYINDAGNQIKLFRASVEASKKGEAIPEGGYHGAYINELADVEDPVQAMIDSHKKVLGRMDVQFDDWFSELSLHKSGAVDAMLDLLGEKGLSYESEGALWFRSTDYGDDKDRVLKKADGAYTYFAVDIAYHSSKINRGYTRLVDIWGADHHGYINRVKAAVKALSDSSLDVIIGQLVTLFRDGEQVRMSKRTGEIITLEEVLDEIGADALRFFMIQKSADTHLEFDLQLATQQNSENPVYYVQYAHARMCRILEKAEGPGGTLSVDDLSLEDYERSLSLSLLQLYDEIYESANQMQSHRIATYSVSLAKLFHGFYHHCPILKSEGDVQAKRLQLLRWTQLGIKDCLGLLGITAPESM